MANSAPSQPPILLTLDQAAEQLQVSVRTLSRWCARGEVPCVRFGPRIVRVRMDSIQRVVAEREGKSAASG